jgi:type IV pilus assembly protein PilE
MAIGSEKARGFTLMELMITVAIVGILTSIALPFYGDYVTRSRLIDGTVKLGDFKARMDKYFADNRTYVNPPGSAVCGLPDYVPGKADYFGITCVGTDTSYLIRAIGDTSTGMPANTFTYRVDQTNAKSSSGPPGWANGVGCWAVRKDGTC